MKIRKIRKELGLLGLSEGSSDQEKLDVIKLFLGIEADTFLGNMQSNMATTMVEQINNMMNTMNEGDSQ